MKILAISHSCVADVNQQLFVSLRQINDAEVELIVPAVWKTEYANHLKIPDILPTVDFPVHRLPVVIPGHVSLHFYKRFPMRQLWKYRPDILLSAQEPWSLSGLQAAWLSKKLRIPLVFHTNQNILKRYPAPFCWIERFSYRTAKAALAYSEEARQVMIAKGLQIGSEVVPYGTDISLFKARLNQKLRAELGLSDSIVIGYMGRFVKEKGLDTLVQAVALILRQQPGVRLKVLMVGSGSEEWKLKYHVEEEGLESQFVFTGAVPHSRAGEYMNCIDIFVLPSRTTPFWKEQFGRVIVEAMACGVPVVGSNSGQIPYLIEDTGGGLVFEEGHVMDMAAKLLALLCDPDRRQRVGQIGAKAVHDRYTYEAVARQTHTILKQTLASTYA